MKSQQAAEEVAAYLRARTPLLWIVTREEARVERYLIEACEAAKYRPLFWDCGDGVTDLNGNKVPTIGDVDIGSTLTAIRKRSDEDSNYRAAERGCFVLRDLTPWLIGPIGMGTVRQVRNLARHLPTTALNTAQAIIVITPQRDIPTELQGHATVIDWPLPDREEIGDILNDAIEVLDEKLQKSAMPNGTREAAIDAAVGLTGEEAQSCFARSLVQFEKIDPEAVAREKKTVISREGVLKWIDPLPGGLDAVGGLENLKAWLTERALAYSAKARKYGLRAPKGSLIVGVQGCGKSMAAKATATAWRVPLLRLDLGGLKSKFVGESEGNLRKAFSVIEAIGRCIIWIDEIEKSIPSGAINSADGGVSADALGAILFWMQERQGEAFIIATANNIEALPPELLRKGRFDEIFFVDLPTDKERIEVLQASLQANGRKGLNLNFAQITAATADFSGAEVAELIPQAMFKAFANNREIDTKDVLEVAEDTTPLAELMAEKVKALREWAKPRARAASKEEVGKAALPRGRAIDMGRSVKV